MHNLINIFAQLLWLSSPPSGFINSLLLLSPDVAPAHCLPSFSSSSSKGPMHKNPLPAPWGACSVTVWDYMYMRYCPATQSVWQGSRLCSVLLGVFVFGVTSTHTPSAGNVTFKKKRETNFKKEHHKLANAEITWAWVGVYIIIWMSCFLQNPLLTLVLFSFPLAAAGLMTTIILYVYTYT